MATVLQYVPFSSMVEPGFWHKLSENKLNVYGLDDKPRQIKGFYFNGVYFNSICISYSSFVWNWRLKLRSGLKWRVCNCKCNTFQLSQLLPFFSFFFFLQGTITNVSFFSHSWNNRLRTFITECLDAQQNTSRVVSADWRKAFVTPISFSVQNKKLRTHYRQYKYNPVNYRPVSLTNICNVLDHIDIIASEKVRREFKYSLGHSWPTAVDWA